MDGGRKRGIVLIGQAPGIVENENGRPFGGRAGKELFRWMSSIDIEEAEFRDHVYIAAVTRCFPGKALSGGGDRKPSRSEIETCRPWLDAALHILEPRCLILVGQLAIERHFRNQRLDQLIGNCFKQAEQTLIPLPHPSGASRWLNDLKHRTLLRNALLRVREQWDQLVVGEE